MERHTCEPERRGGHLTTRAISCRKGVNEAISRSPVGTIDVAAECGRAGGVLDAVTERARDAGVLRPDFGLTDLGTLV